MLTPDYPFFCKRALFIDDYYTSFNKPNVQLVHDDGGVVGVDSSGLTVGCGATNAAEFRAVVFFSENRSFAKTGSGLTFTTAAFFSQAITTSWT